MLTSEFAFFNWTLSLEEVLAFLIRFKSVYLGFVVWMQKPHRIGVKGGNEVTLEAFGDIGAHHFQCVSSSHREKIKKQPPVETLLLLLFHTSTDYFNVMLKFLDFV